MTDPTPAMVEASGVDTIDVDFGGNTYTIPATSDDWAIETLEQFELGHATQALKAILGPKQYGLFKSRHRVKDFNAFCDIVAERYGFKSSGN